MTAMARIGHTDLQLALPCPHIEQRLAGRCSLQYRGRIF
jgi:hypothetical protein